jgi:putative peptidoglycan lipid II flippase
VAAVALMIPLGHAGLAAASSISAYVNVLALVAAARRRLGRLGGGALVASVARTAVASVPVAIWCWLLLAVWPEAHGTRADLALLLIGVAGGAGVFLIGSALIGAPERTAFAAILPRRRRG